MIDNRRLHPTFRGKHPCDRAPAGIRIVRQQAGMALRNVEHDGPGLEQGEVAFFVGRNLPEGMRGQVRRFLHLTERKKANVVSLALHIGRGDGRPRFVAGLQTRAVMQEAPKDYKLAADVIR